MVLLLTNIIVIYSGSEGNQDSLWPLLGTSKELTLQKKSAYTMFGVCIDLFRNVMLHVPGVMLGSYVIE